MNIIAPAVQGARLPRRVESRLGRRRRAGQDVRSPPHPPLVPGLLGVFRRAYQLLALGAERLELVGDLHQVAVHLFNIVGGAEGVGRGGRREEEVGRGRRGGATL